MLLPCSLRAAHLVDAETVFADIREGLRTDSYAANHLPSPSLPFSVSESGLLLHHGKIYVLDFKDLCLRVLQEHHDHPVSGHFGYAKTLEAVHQDDTWPDMHRYIQTYCASCSECARAKSSRHRPYGLLKPLPIPEKPWSSISMDLIEQLPDSDGSTAILVVVDRLTQSALFIPMKETWSMDRLAKAYIHFLVKRFGVPTDIISDRDSRFLSRFWRKFQEAYGTRLKTSTAFHPMTDGQTERTIQTLEDMLRACVLEFQGGW